MKQKQLQSVGKGNKPSKAEELSENYFKLFYEKHINITYKFNVHDLYEPFWNETWKRNS